MKKITLIVLAALTTACSSYEFGDVSRVYCATTSTELRAQIKVTLKENGVSIGVDYCASAGLVDAILIKSPKE